MPDDPDPPVAGVPARVGARLVPAQEIARLSRLRGPQRLLQRDVHRVELVVARDLLRQGAAAEVFEDDEGAHEVEEAALLEDPREEDLERRQPRRRVLPPTDRAPRLE